MPHPQFKAKVVRIHSILITCKIEERVGVGLALALNIPTWLGCNWVISKNSNNMVLALGPFKPHINLVLVLGPRLPFG